jgi:hypothetical protein
MPNRPPKNISDTLKMSIYNAADEANYMIMSRTEAGQFMDGLVRRKDIGGVLESYIAKPQVRHYIKDAVLNRYTKDKTRGALNIDLVGAIKREFGLDVTKSDDRDGVSLYRSQHCAVDGKYVVVANGTYLKWETALKKALCFTATAPFSQSAKLIQILVVLYAQQKIITPSDKRLLANALKACGAKAHIVGE